MNENTNITHQNLWHADKTRLKFKASAREEIIRTKMEINEIEKQ